MVAQHKPVEVEGDVEHHPQEVERDADGKPPGPHQGCLSNYQRVECGDQRAPEEPQCQSVQ